MVNHYILGPYISVHDAFTVAKIQGLKQLENIESDIGVVEFGIETSEISVVDIFKDKRWCFTLVPLVSRRWVDMGKDEIPDCL